MEITSNPVLHRAARDCLHEVERHAAGINFDQFYTAIQPLLIWAPPSNLPAERELKVQWFQIGHKAVKDIPLEAFADAVSSYIATSDRQQFPAWGKLAKLAEDKATQIRKIAWRVKAAAMAPTPTKAGEKSPEEVAKVRAMLKEFMGAPKPDVSLLPPGETPHQMAARLRGC